MKFSIGDMFFRRTSNLDEEPGIGTLLVTAVYGRDREEARAYLYDEEGVNLGPISLEAASLGRTFFESKEELVQDTFGKINARIFAYLRDVDELKASAVAWERIGAELGIFKGDEE